MSKSYIDDGYTINGFIRAESNLYDALRFHFRPLRVEERFKFFRALDKVPEDEQIRHAAKLMKDRLQDWDLANGDSKTMPVSVQALLNLQVRLFDKLFGIIIGSQGSDDEPEGMTAELREAKDAGNS